MIRCRARHILFVAFFAAAPFSLAQSSGHQHTSAGNAQRATAVEASPHAFLEQERAVIERGEGFGVAMPAERNGYPGPKHVLERKAALELTLAQDAAIEKLFAQMKERALARGKEVLAAETRLEQMFAQGRPEAELREEVCRVATLRAELRWVHLSAHLAARRLLSPGQLAAYARLRGNAR